MGSRSRTSTESHVQNTQDIRTENTDESLNLAAGGVAARGDVHITDGGIARDSLDFANEVVRSNVDALQVGQQIGRSALDFAGETNQDAYDFAAQQSEASRSTLALVADATRSDTTETFRRVALYGAVAVTLIFVAMQFRKG